MSEPVVHHHGREGGRCRGQRGAAVCFNSLLARLATNRSTFPSSPILLRVHDRDNVEDPRQELVEHHIGEALDTLASKLAVDDGSFFRIVLDSGQSDPEVITKTLAQTLATIFVEP